MSELLIQKALRHLRIAKACVDELEGDEGFVMGDSLTEVIEALEFEEGELDE